MDGLHDGRTMATDPERPVSRHLGEGRRVSTVRHDDAMGDRVGLAVSTRRPGGALECSVCERFQRDEADGEPDERGTLVRPESVLMVLGNWDCSVSVESCRGIAPRA